VEEREFQTRAAGAFHLRIKKKCGIARILNKYELLTETRGKVSKLPHCGNRKKRKRRIRDLQKKNGNSVWESWACGHEDASM